MLIFTSRAQNGGFGLVRLRAPTTAQPPEKYYAKEAAVAERSRSHNVENGAEATTRQSVVSTPLNHRRKIVLRDSGG